MDIVSFGDAEDSAIVQLVRCLSTVRDAGDPDPRGVLCADHHKGYSMPIGGVLASQAVIIPAGVGYDIACGNCAVQTTARVDDLRTEIPKVMDAIWDTISFGMGRKNNERIHDHPVFDAIHQSPVAQQRGLLEMAKGQLGTVGSGNHYVDLFEDRADGRLWIGVHFGSRGLGHKTACGFMALAQGKEWGARVDDSMDSPPSTIHVDTPLGQDYLRAMEIAGEYAYAGRDWVVDRVLRLLGLTALERIHNHHNFAWWEMHDGVRWLVTRKGATPAFPGQKGFVGGSMGDDAVILEGVDSDQAAHAFYSTVHGAGRVMSRTQAAGRTKMRRVWACGQRDCPGELPFGQTARPADGSNPKCPVCKSKTHDRRRESTERKGVVDWPAWQARLKAQGVELRGGGADEAPECYKRLQHVLGEHGSTVRLLHTLKPIGVAMAGRDTEDPYKD